MGLHVSEFFRIILESRGDLGWPLGRVAPRGGASEVVLLATGALNPVHLGHVAMLERARAALESDGLDVVGGFLSPSHDAYVGPKAAAGGEAALPASVRLDLCRLALEGLPWAAAASWESSVRGGWPDYPEVVESLAAALEDRWGSAAPRVVYVCGADHYRNNVRHSGLPGVAVVSRSGAEVPSDPARGIHSVPVGAADPVVHLSSSAVRAAARRGDLAALRAALHPAVLEALLGSRADFFGLRA